MKFMLLILIMAVAFCWPGTNPPDEQLIQDAQAYFGQLEVLPDSVQRAPQVELGRLLFWDEQLSSDGKTACASCHTVKDWGSDRRVLSINARGKTTSRHSQSVFNAMDQPMLRWRGDRRSGAEQAQGSITGSMGFDSKEEFVKKLEQLNYLPAFRAAFPTDTEPLSPHNYGKALEAYQATLRTYAPFDRFIAGDAQALNSTQKAGLRAFMDTGCAGCHDGPLFGGKSLQKFGLAKNYWLETGSEKIDEGRFAVTKKEDDKYVFRVQMLRNIAKTAPYFHDGSVATLDEAVRIMASVQVGIELNNNDCNAIVVFLESLTGDIPKNFNPPDRRQREE